MCATFVISKKTCSKLSYTLGENSPDLVTLIVSQFLYAADQGDFIFSQLHTMTIHIKTTALQCINS
jgi:hypothetical protein